jgi:regulator of sigma E protease
VVVGEVLHGGGAEAAGLKTGDRITAVDGVPVDDFATFVDLIHHRPDTTARLEVVRAGATLTLPVGVHAEANPAKPDGPKIGRIGIGPGGEAQWPPGMLTEQRYGPFAAIGAAVQATWEETAFTVKLLSRMVTGHVSAKNVSGPLSIATYAGLTARAGGLAFISFLALISISLGVLNLVPIPILDGGQIVYQCAEAIRGRPLSERVQALGQQQGVAKLIVLMALAFYNDIARQLG